MIRSSTLAARSSWNPESAAPTLTSFSEIRKQSAYAHFREPEIRLAYATVNLWALFRKVFIS